MARVTCGRSTHKSLNVEEEHPDVKHEYLGLQYVTVNDYLIMP